MARSYNAGASVTSINFMLNVDIAGMARSYEAGASVTGINLMSNRKITVLPALTKRD